MGLAFGASGMRGGLLDEIALLATSLDLVVAVLADTSAQIRIRPTPLLVAGIAPGAASLGFEAVLGTLMAGVLVRMLDTNPNQPIPVTDQAGSESASAC